MNAMNIKNKYTKYVTNKNKLSESSIKDKQRYFDIAINKDNQKATLKNQLSQLYNTEKEYTDIKCKKILSKIHNDTKNSDLKFLANIFDLKEVKSFIYDSNAKLKLDALSAWLDNCGSDSQTETIQNNKISQDTNTTKETEKINVDKFKNSKQSINSLKINAKNYYKTSVVQKIRDIKDYNTRVEVIKAIDNINQLCDSNCEIDSKKLNDAIIPIMECNSFDKTDILNLIYHTAVINTHRNHDKWFSIALKYMSLPFMFTLGFVLEGIRNAPVIGAIGRNDEESDKFMPEIISDKQAYKTPKRYTTNETLGGDRLGNCNNTQYEFEQNQYEALNYLAGGTKTDGDCDTNASTLKFGRAAAGFFGLGLHNTVYGRVQFARYTYNHIDTRDNPNSKTNSSNLLEYVAE